MKIDILTLFPKMFDPILNESIIKRAQEKGLIKINIHNLRDWATDKHKTVDDTAYGGGAGMILKADVIDSAIASLKFKIKNLTCLPARQELKIVLLTPQGKRFTQNTAKRLAKLDNLILICGHYGGYDERIRNLVDEQISLGDFVLTGGEIPAIAIIDAVVRLVPNVINPDSLKDETHARRNYKQYPQYTRPEKFNPKSIITKKELSVPSVLLSGNHKQITKWRNNNF